MCDEFEDFQTRERERIAVGMLQSGVLGEVVNG
jgi:hypothetical protein